MSLFKKKRAGNIRERITAFDDEEDEKKEENIPGLNINSNGAPGRKKKNKDKRPAVNALSFEDELEGNLDY